MVLEVSNNTVNKLYTGALWKSMILNVMFFYPVEIFIPYHRSGEVEVVFPQTQLTRKHIVLFYGLKRIAGSDWMAKTGDRVLWRTLGEAYVQQWTAIG